MKILFMGTPQIAADSLNEIIKAGHEVCAVFTREDKPVGRKQILTASPVKALALKNDINVYQPKTLKDDEQTRIISDLNPDLVVVVAYGRILPKVIIDIPKLGCINLHVSLLPKYRGAAPIQWAVLNGEEETGVSIMYIKEGIDTGDIITVSRVKIGENETSGELFERIASLGARVLVDTIADLECGKAQRTPQDNSLATLAPPLTKEQAFFDFSLSAQSIHNLVRGLNPWPVAYFEFEDKKIKVLKTKIHTDAGKEVGEIVGTKPLIIQCQKGAIELCEVVPEGKAAMTGNAWAFGKRFTVGDKIHI